MWREVISLHESVEIDDFWSGVSVWIERPHILNKKLIGMETLETLDIVGPRFCDVFNYLLKLSSNVEAVCDLNSVMNTYFKTLPQSSDSNSSQTIHLRKLLPKRRGTDAVMEVLIIDEAGDQIAFLPLELSSAITPAFPYKISFQNGSITLSVHESLSVELSKRDQSSITWLRWQILAKIVHWSHNAPRTKVTPSLSKISMKVYCRIYIDLKFKYGKKLVENWPEKTDPTKFVYEDIAIAAYLMTLWEKENELLGVTEKQSFVDLGCGNGLLVHLLTSEGHPGIGVDIRKRKIWDFYDSKVELKEEVIVPSDSMLFPEYDWIIGNHSDELTPWIPIIAARSSYKMRVFLLPCCAFTFDGKYDRGDASCSKYQSYLYFVEELCETAGFYVHRDRLRIPSTKRVCFICSARSYKPDDEAIVERQRLDYIQKHSKAKGSLPDLDVELNRCGTDSDLASDSWSQSFKPREKIESVRNCCALDRLFLESMVVKVMNLLLQSDDSVIQLKTDRETSIPWRSGGEQTIRDIASSLGQENLLRLKNQHGGVQTLLRNHKNIFRVVGGRVSLAAPSNDSQPSKKRRAQKGTKRLFLEKPCTFFFHHPDGCPFLNKCNFSHLKN